MQNTKAIESYFISMNESLLMMVNLGGFEELQLCCCICWSDDLIVEGNLLRKRRKRKYFSDSAMTPKIWFLLGSRALQLSFIICLLVMRSDKSWGQKTLTALNVNQRNGVHSSEIQLQRGFEHLPFIICCGFYW